MLAQAGMRSRAEGKVSLGRAIDVERVGVFPLLAIAVGGAAIGNAATSAITVGGLVVDEDTGEVYSSEGGKVKGLYAAGRTAVGICSYYYVSGLSLGDCVYSGCRAAETIKGNGGSVALV